ncbi:MAG: NAD(P)H-dependent oxidoreductase subunit E [Robiginitomaculum sp.]|nr:NAD(P)H-dependent oxidoreductase subunit E [Robiginitomaculum sp.]
MHNWNYQRALQIIEECAKSSQVLTSALRQLVDDFGYIDDAAIAPLAKAFLRSKAEVYGAIQYYSDFRDSAPAEHILRICQAESCQAVGSRKITKLVTTKTGIALGQTSSDGQISLEPVYCLGLCANGPAAEFDGNPVAELDEAKIDKILSGIRS